MSAREIMTLIRITVNSENMEGNRDRVTGKGGDTAARSSIERVCGIIFIAWTASAFSIGFLY